MEALQERVQAIFEGKIVRVALDSCIEVVDTQEQDFEGQRKVEQLTRIVLVAATVSSMFLRNFILLIVGSHFADSHDLTPVQALEFGARKLWNTRFISILGLSSEDPVPIQAELKGMRWTIKSAAPGDQYTKWPISVSLTLNTKKHLLS